ncbi:hypothetical protein SAMCFNEI73_pC1816 (plasmid) [Sinorhizobium americanum]|uniref:Uncharacterized protein n=2 Tax=Sinorhizobium americanum TaxID=194963 RepID=A0A1L3LZL7_9HYPH|nr:hypothetical protein SAMCFNEI73_pC1816 [Sinorhizobium americanum]
MQLREGSFTSLLIFVCLAALTLSPLFGALGWRFRGRLVECGGRLGDRAAGDAHRGRLTTTS